MELFELRELERIIIVLLGGLSIYLGYLLFLHLPEQRDSEGKIILPGNISAYVSRVGPGVFFALFGTSVIGLSLHYEIEYERSLKPNALVEKFSGSLASPSPTKNLPAISMADEQFEIERLIRGLNQLLSYLSEDVDSDTREEAENSIREAKLELMKGVWFTNRESVFEQFSDFVRRGMDTEPDDELREYVAIFQRGLE